MNRFVLLGLLAIAGCGEKKGGPDPEADADGDADGDGDLDREYCDCMMQNCGGEFATDFDCLTEAARIPHTGAEGDTSGNTLQCRIYHCGAAAAAPGEHCPHALGEALCVGDDSGPAVEYCDCMAQNCPDVFANEDECLNVAVDLPAGESDTQTGANLECRLYHCGAAEQDPGVHCPHAAGDQICVPDPLDVDYCTCMADHCGDVFASETECLAEAASIPHDGAADATTGNSIQCRLYHCGVAPKDPPLHCGHAAGEDPCS